MSFSFDWAARREVCRVEQNVRKRPTAAAPPMLTDILIVFVLILLNGRTK
jgi:hypothetical protein